MAKHIFHEGNLARVPFRGGQLVNDFEARLQEVERDSRRYIDPNVTVLMRTQNDLEDVQGILDDINRQRSVDGIDRMFTGDVQVVLVDTESRDGTVEVAREWGAEIVPVTQEGFSYPDALNRGFEAAAYPHVFSIVGHSAVTSDMWLRVATRHRANHNLAGVAGVSLPNKKTKFFEGVTNLDTYRRLREPAGLVTEMRMGLLATNSSMFRREAWEELRFDKRYAAGGEDMDFARRAMDAGMGIMADAGASVYHSHGLDAIGSLRQFGYWSKLGQGKEFSREALLRFRSDLRAKQQD